MFNLVFYSHYLYTTSSKNNDLKKKNSIPVQPKPKKDFIPENYNFWLNNSI
jgi:hypothetical protein